MLRQSVRPQQGTPAKAFSLQSFLSDCQELIRKPGSAYSWLIDKVKASSTIHVPSTRLSIHAFADGLVHLIGPRFVSHLLILAVAAVVATVSGISTSQMTRASTLKPWQFEPFATRSFSQSKDFLDKPALPFTDPPPVVVPTSKGREGIVSYAVVPGDTVTGIAERFGVSMDTILSANKLDDADSLSVGDKLTILPVSGILHSVRDGETVESVATKYKVEGRAIIEYEQNHLVEPYHLFIDQKIIVPGGKMPEVPRPMPVARSDRPSEPPAGQASSAPAASAPVRGGGRFVWPTTGGITQGYSAYHTAIDIAPPWGAPIYASEGGVVVSVEYLSYGYGWNLLIDHGDGFSSRYSHLSKFLVSQGQSVTRGQMIGLNGSTGYSTGPHLDFRIYQNGAAVNPLKYLP